MLASRAVPPSAKNDEGEEDQKSIFQQFAADHYLPRTAPAIKSNPTDAPPHKRRTITGTMHAIFGASLRCLCATRGRHCHLSGKMETILSQGISSTLL